MTQAQLATAIATALASAMGKSAIKTKGRKGTKGRGRAKLTEAEKVAYRAKNDAETIEVFTKAGFTDVQPRVNVMTYDKWIETKGRRVKKGEKSHKVGPFSLFHEEQTQPLSAVANTTVEPTLELVH